MGVSILLLQKQKEILEASEKGFITLKDLNKIHCDTDYDLDEVKKFLKENKIDYFEDDDYNDDECDIENINDKELLMDAKRHPGLSGYISEICSYKILNFEEEQTLRTLIFQGRLADKELKGNLKEISKEQIEKLKEISIQGQQARDKIILTHLRLVLHYARQFQGNGVSLEDLIQEGTQGMLYAIEKFDLKRNIKFSTYATFWIKQSCQRAICELGHSKKIPASAHYQLKKFLRTKAILTQENGFEPSDEEVCKVLGLSEKKFKTIQDTYNNKAISLDTPINNSKPDSDRITIEDVISDDSVSPINIMIEDEKMRTVFNLINDENFLTPRERKVLIYRFGLFNQPKKTLEELGNEIGVTRERVRQIEEKIIEKFKTNPELLKLMI